MPVICVIIGLTILASIAVSYRIDHHRPSNTETADFDFHKPLLTATTLWFRLKHLLGIVVHEHHYEERYVRRRMARTPSYGSITSGII